MPLNKCEQVMELNEEFYRLDENRQILARAAIGVVRSVMHGWDYTKPVPPGNRLLHDKEINHLDTAILQVMGVPIMSLHVAKAGLSATQRETFTRYRKEAIENAQKFFGLPQEGRGL